MSDNNLSMTYNTEDVNGRQYRVVFYGTHSVAVTHFVSRKHCIDPSIDDIARVISKLLGYPVTLRDIGYNEFVYRRS